MSPHYAFVFGTRPEIIKMAPFIKTALARGKDFSIIHTGQHYSEFMDKVFWDELELPDPEHNLGVGSGTHAQQVGKMMIAVEPVLDTLKPDFLCVYADLNSSIAGALAAAKLHVPIVQLEAGLRSFDRTMPEEVNRLVVDRLAHVLFPPTPLQRQHLEAEGIRERLFVVGNLIADVVPTMLPRALERSTIHKTLGVNRGEYFLATMHRPSGVDNQNNFSNMLRGLGKVARAYNAPVIYPIHPRSRKNFTEFGITPPDGVRLIDPLGYYDFLALEAGAKVMLSDSGGIQEEAAILGVPLVTLRESTERQETLALGSNVLAGFDPDVIFEKVREMESRPRTWRHPYGEGVAEKMWDALESL